MSPDFATGWRYDLEDAARKLWAQSGSPPRYTSAALFGDPDIKLPAGFTLANEIRWWQNQGPVGSCFANGPAMSMQIGLSYGVTAGLAVSELQLSRRWIWYYGRKLDGLLGSWSDGGSVTNAMRAIHQFGIPPEADWEYKADHGWLEQSPSQAAIAAAKPFGLKAILDLQYGDPEGIKRSIYSGLAPVPGFRWPRGWDRGSIDRYGRTTQVGYVNPRDGHALCIVGWADAGVWDEFAWWHICNSHGPIYPLPSPSMRSAIEGFASAQDEACYCFWVRDDMLQSLVRWGGGELVAPVGPYSPDARRPISWIDAAS